MNVNVIHVVNKCCNPTLDLVGYHWGGVVSSGNTLRLSYTTSTLIDKMKPLHHSCQLCSDQAPTLSEDDHFSLHGTERYASALNLRRPLRHFGALYPNSGLLRRVPLNLLQGPTHQREGPAHLAETRRSQSVSRCNTRCCSLSSRCFSTNFDSYKHVRNL